MTLTSLHRSPRRGWLTALQSSITSAIFGAIACSVVAVPARAESPETAPTPLIELIDRIDNAASSQDIDAVMDFYSNNFVHEDGLTRSSLRSSLSKLWERFPSISYDTELLSWEATESGYITETETTITGIESALHRNYELDATLRSRQTYEDGQIVYQEILFEEVALTSGDNPPTLTVNLPEATTPNSSYNFDVIVREPLNEDFLLGAAIEEAAAVENYLNSAELELELLSAGGLFKIGQTEAQEGDYWVSGAIVRDSGIAIVTRRMAVKK